MTRSRRILGLTIAVLVAAMVGCAPVSQDEPSGDPAPAVTTVSPTPTPTPEPTKPAVSELLLSPDGLGPLRVGAAPPVTDPELDILVFDPDYCADSEVTSTPGMWVANYPREANGHRPFAGFLKDGSDTVRVISIFSPEIRTATGIHIGSTRAELMAAYPDGFDAQVDRWNISNVYSIHGMSGQLLVEVRSDGIPGYWEPEDENKVSLLTVTAKDMEPFGVSGGDNYWWDSCG